MMIPSFGYPTTTQGSLTEWGDLPMSRTWQGGCESPSLIPTTPPKRGANYFLPFRSAQHATGKMPAHSGGARRPYEEMEKPKTAGWTDARAKHDKVPKASMPLPLGSMGYCCPATSTNEGWTHAPVTGRAAPTPPWRKISDDKHMRAPGKSASHKSCIAIIPMFGAVEPDVSPTYSLPSPASTGRAPNATMRTAIKNNMDLVITTSLVSFGPRGGGKAPPQGRATPGACLSG